ncbi:hypothetical protein ACFVT5_40000 [Streptomyces sp. NPDC058001]|uniref:SCO2400 family protein n=1 Tax=Streptomyces sp. NPDC058001 TaxID=3346300 RepID=UPI0036EFA63F
MDYCSSCRRHLNGALVCPGCGAYAPDIAPVAELDLAMNSMNTVAVVDTVPPTPNGHVAVPAPMASIATADYEFEPSGDVYAPAPLPQGRAARRRQRAQWKKNQRRAVVATAVALVGGGLTVAAMDRGSADRAQAASAPEHDGPDVESMGVAEEEATQEPEAPAARPGGRHRAPDSSTSTSTGRTVADVPRQQSAVAPQHNAPPSTVRADTTDRKSLATAVPKPVTTPPVVSDTVPDTVVTPPPAQTPAPADPGAPAANPAPEKTKPQLCVLVLCIG